jgi:hypothetical protein
MRNQTGFKATLEMLTAENNVHDMITFSASIKRKYHNSFTLGSM